MIDVRTAIIGVFIALAFTRGALAEESVVLDMNIVLIAGIYIKPLPSWYLCTVDENYFTVPRSCLTRKVVITAENGVSIHFPYQAHQCKPVEVWAK